MASSTIKGDLRSFVPGNQAFAFLKLPSEIRVAIYTYTFSDLGILRSAPEIVSANDRWLDQVRSYPRILTFAGWCWFLRPGQTHPDRTHTEQDFIVQLSNKDAVPILRTCQLVFQEASPILYQMSTFHHSISPKRTDLPISIQLKWIRHLSIDFSDASPKTLMFEQLKRYDVDNKVGAAVVLIVKGCTSLKSLTLHIIATGGIDQILLRSSRESCKALGKLSPTLERMSIIAPSTTKSMKELCDLIAPLQDWKVRRARRWPLRWPLLTVPVAQFETIRAVTDKSSCGDYRTRKDVVCVQVATLQPERGIR